MQPGQPGPGVPSSVPVSPEIKELMQDQGDMSDAMDKLRAQGTNGAPSPQALTQYMQQNAAFIQREKDVAKSIAQKQSLNPLPMPPPLQLPPNASPQLKAFLTSRDQLRRDEIVFLNEHMADTTSERQAALQDWRQQNADRMRQLQQQALALAPHAATSSK